MFTASNIPRSVAAESNPERTTGAHDQEGREQTDHPSSAQSIPQRNRHQLPQPPQHSRSPSCPPSDYHRGRHQRGVTRGGHTTQYSRLSTSGTRGTRGIRTGSQSPRTVHVQHVGSVTGAAGIFLITGSGYNLIIN